MSELQKALDESVKRTVAEALLPTTQALTALQTELKTHWSMVAEELVSNRKVNQRFNEEVADFSLNLASTVKQLQTLLDKLDTLIAHKQELQQKEDRVLSALIDELDLK